MTTEQPAEYGLVIPFVACNSKGGPYDDDAFTAGYQAGRIDYALAALAVVGGTELSATVRTDLVQQLDLIAMHHGFRLQATPCADADGWSLITIRKES